MLLMCTICTELVKENEHICATTCGHIYHQQCLAPWVRSSQNCPQCRKPVSEASLFRVYPSSGEAPTRGVREGGGHAVATTSREASEPTELPERDSDNFSISDLQAMVPEDRFSFEEYAAIQDKIQFLRGLLASVQQELFMRNNDVVLLQVQLKSMESLTREYVTQIETLKRKVSAAKKEVVKEKKITENFKRQFNTTRTELDGIKRNNLDLTEKLQQAERDLRIESGALADSRRTVTDLRQQLEGSTNKINKLKEKNSYLAQRLQDFTRAVRDTAADMHVDYSFIVYERQEFLALKTVEVLAQLVAENNKKLSSRDSYIAKLESELWHVKAEMRNNISSEESKRRITWYATDTNCYGSQLYYGQLPVGEFSSDFYQSNGEIQNKSEVDAVISTDFVSVLNSSGTSSPVLSEAKFTTLEAVQMSFEPAPSTVKAIVASSETLLIKSDTLSVNSIVAPGLYEEIMIKPEQRMSLKSTQTASETELAAFKIVPNSLEALPNSLEIIPNSLEAASNETVPTTFKAVLTTINTVPSTSEYAVNTFESVLTTLEAVPTTLEAITTTFESITTTSEAVPLTSDEVPTTSDAVSTTSKAVPTTIEAVATTSESLSNNSEALTSTSQSISPASKAIPATSETITTTSETVLTTPVTVLTTSESVSHAHEVLLTESEELQTQQEILACLPKFINITAPLVSPKIPLASEVVLRSRAITSPHDHAEVNIKPVAPKPSPRSIQSRPTVAGALHTKTTSTTLQTITPAPETALCTLKARSSSPIPKPRTRSFQDQPIAPKALSIRPEKISTTLDAVPISSKTEIPTLRTVPSSPVPKQRLRSIQVQPTVPKALPSQSETEPEAVPIILVVPAVSEAVLTAPKEVPNVSEEVRSVLDVEPN